MPDGMTDLEQRRAYAKGKGIRYEAFEKWQPGVERDFKKWKKEQSTGLAK